MAKLRSKYTTSFPVFTPEDPPDGPRTVVCFGTARGGTSMVAGAILGLGVPMGEGLRRNLEDPDFNMDLHGGPLNPFVRDARKVIETRNETLDIWGWKFPFAQRYLHRLIDDLRAPRLVCVFRDPVPTALRTELTPGQEAFFLASRLRAQIRNATMIEELRVPCLMVSYEKAAAQPDVFLEELAAFLGLSVPEHRDEIVAFMRPGEYKTPDALLARLTPPAADHQ